jgi:hypothetical protein
MAWPAKRMILGVVFGDPNRRTESQSGNVLGGGRSHPTMQPSPLLCSLCVLGSSIIPIFHRLSCRHLLKQPRDTTGGYLFRDKPDISTAELITVVESLAFWVCSVHKSRSCKCLKQCKAA